ncbi:hypothetical protein A3A59_06280 [Candidatus Gottesmanbacteria bacterium RIFCSPLOWO2_01_FULL_42_10]|nr:MAG: hypothetical protein A3A59_06280 [Candidatus Gottesmanbacteria bacterium RIFCSPLOWO2_01_FULL_42_10]
MKNRYKLPAGIQRKYLIEVESKSRSKPYLIAKYLHINPRSYRDWKREKFSLTTAAVNILEKKFQTYLPYSKSKALDTWKTHKSRMARKGGIALTKKYGGPGTPEGRSKGGKHAMALLRKRGIIAPAKPFYHPHRYSENLAEFVGILLGDGHIGKKQWSITLNSLADKKYALYVKRLIISLFHFQPSIHNRKDYHVNVILGSGIKSIQYFQKIGLLIGNKVKQQVDVPEWIKFNPLFCIACLRGLVDTDGGIFKHSYTVNSKRYSYIKLCFVNRSIPLLNFAYKTLTDSGFHPKQIMQVANKRVWLYNQSEVKDYLKIVGTRNHRLLKNLEESDSWSIREVC